MSKPGMLRIVNISYADRIDRNTVPHQHDFDSAVSKGSVTSSRD